MKAILLLLLLLFVGIQHSISTSLPCTGTSPTPYDIVHLHTLCLADSRCAARYEQVPSSNYDVFENLLLGAALYNSIDEPYDVLFCNKSIPEALDVLTPLLLVYWRSMDTLCPPNHVYVPDGISGTCECAPGHDCGNFSWWNAWQLALLGLITLFLLVLFVSSVGHHLQTAVTTTKKE